MRASPLETYQVGTCYKCGGDVFYDEDREVYIFTGAKEACDCVREGDDDKR